MSDDEFLREQVRESAEKLHALLGKVSSDQGREELLAGLSYPPPTDPILRNHDGWVTAAAKLETTSRDLLFWLARMGLAPGDDTPP